MTTSERVAGKPDYEYEERMGRRTPYGDLLAAFIMSGWEELAKVEDADDLALRLAKDNGENAWRLSGYLMRGEEVPHHLVEWARTVYAPTTAQGSEGG